MRRTAITCLVLALAWATATASPTATVNTGHRQRIAALRYEVASGLLFSASEDGLVIAWEASTGRPVSRLQVSRMSVRELAVHPRLPQLAVVEGDGTVTRLSVWDYVAARRLYTVELDMAPSSLAYSSTGRYLVLCRERYDSLLFLDPATGGRLPLFTGGFGIVSFVTFNGDDAVMMSYQAGGEVRYWDVATETQRFRAMSTEPLLESVSLSGSADSPKDALVGAAGSSLVVVDIVRNGAVKGRAALPEVIAVASTDRGEIVALARGTEGAVLSRWRCLPESGLLRLEAKVLGGALWGAGSPVALALGAVDSYVGCSDGTIVVVPPYGESRVFSRNVLATVTDVAMSGSDLLVAVGGGVVSFRGDTVGPAGAGNEGTAPGPPEVRAARTAVALAGPIRLARSPEGEIWAWSTDGGEVIPLVSDATRIGQGGLSFAGPLKSVAWSRGELCVVERSGRCSILVEEPGQRTFSEVFAYVCPGANAMVATPRAVVLGKSSLQRGDGALLFVDRRTGETVSLPGDDDLVYELSYGADSDGILAIGVGREPAARTSLIRLSGGQYSDREVILRYEGEDTGAAIAARGSEAYTSLGYGVSRVSGGSAVGRESAAVPRRLALGGELLACLNLDGSIGLWRTSGLEPVADVFVFDDEEWVVMSAGGQPYAASPGGARHLAERSTGGGATR